MNYISIQASIQDAVAEGRLCILTPVLASDPARRCLLLHPELQADLNDAAADVRMQRLRADLESFVAGSVLAVSTTPYHHGTAFLGLLDPPSDGLWESEAAIPGRRYGCSAALPLATCSSRCTSACDPAPTRVGPTGGRWGMGDRRPTSWPRSRRWRVGRPPCPTTDQSQEPIPVTSFQTTISSELLSDGALSPGTRAFLGARLRNRLHDLVLRRFQQAERERGLTRAELARTLGKRPEQITNLLGAPGNWTLQTVAELLAGIGREELVTDAVPFAGRPPANAQPLDIVFAKAQPASPGARATLGTMASRPLHWTQTRAA